MEWQFISCKWQFPSTASQQGYNNVTLKELTLITYVEFYSIVAFDQIQSLLSKR